MCGIVAYTGFNNASKVLVETLAKLEYRGYDSVGIAVFSDDKIDTRKTKGKIVDLQEVLKQRPLNNNFSGIGHTRWATHGEPTDVNSHPHGTDNLVLVHNGIIENYQSLKNQLVQAGYQFESQTDTEVLAKCLDYCFEMSNDVLKALQMLSSKISGSYALSVMFSHQKDVIYTMRKDSPLIIGLGKQENFVASDMSALLKYTSDYYLLEENEIGIIEKTNVTVLNLRTLEKIEKEIQVAHWDEGVAEKEGYDHFMLKEIMEQPAVFSRAIAGRIDLDRIDFKTTDSIEDTFFENVSAIHLIGCGTAYHAGLIGKKFIEHLSGIPVRVHIASEFRYDLPILNSNDLVVLVSQSGETADTVAAMRLAKEMNIKTLAICNVVGSTICRESDEYLLIHAQLEIAVASTKAYFAQLVVLALVGFKLSQLNHQFTDETKKLLDEFKMLKQTITKTLENQNKVEELANKYYVMDNLFFIGRKMDYLLSLEASLKLKEISYIHSEAYPAGELKHGTISLIEKDTPVIALASDKEVFDKTISNAQEVKSRGAKVLLITTIDNEESHQLFDNVITIQPISELLSCFTMIVLLQFFAYYVAKARGCEIDQPRNLAKSVTVE